MSITNDAATLRPYHADDLQTGAGSFVLNTTFATFSTAMVTKTGREITGTVPEPTSPPLAGLALVEQGMLRRLRAV